jgi:hypothetical protein
MWAVNRVGAVLLGLVLLAGGLLVALEMVLVASGLGPLLPLEEWQRALNTTTHADRWVLGVSIAVGVFGVLVLAAQLRPWPPHRVLTGDPGGTEWWVSRRSVERRVEDAAESVTGVTGAHADIRGAERRWRLRMSAQARPERRDAIQGAVRDELERLSAPTDVPVGVTLRKPRGPE